MKPKVSKVTYPQTNITYDEWVKEYADSQGFTIGSSRF